MSGWDGDDPSKAMQYAQGGFLFICAVFLGDCLCVDHLPNKSTFVREPVKSDPMKRNHSDLFFDSIVGRPASSANEYVVYNRHQCVPLYVIHYTAGKERKSKIFISFLNLSSRLI